MIGLSLLLVILICLFPKLLFYAGVVALLYKIGSVVNEWRIYFLHDEDYLVALQGLKALIGRGRKETELLLSGSYGRRVAAGYIFKDLARFSEGQSYLNAYLRNRTKVGTTRAVAELGDRLSFRRPDHGANATTAKHGSRV
jgi:hypothetical protein